MVYNNPVVKSNTENYAGFWNTLFIDINTANGVLQYGAAADIPAATKHSYWHRRNSCVVSVITTWLPHLDRCRFIPTFNTSPSAADAPSPLADLYAQMIKDFTESAADLPNVPAAGMGKPATKPTALFLLAKTYLWRGWSAAAQATDFQQAYTVAKSVIDAKATYNLDLVPYFGNVFREGNEYGPEVMMVIDHTKDLKFGQNSAVGAALPTVSENKSNFIWRPNYPTLCQLSYQ
jgi:hypothetical protein